VEEDYELEHEVLLRKRRGPLNTLYLYVFLESPDGNYSPEVLLKQKRIIGSEVELSDKLNLNRRWVEVHPRVLLYPLITGRDINTIQQYREEFHMGSDYQQVYPLEDQAPK